MEDFDVAVKYALGAGNLFDVNTPSDYMKAILGACFSLSFCPFFAFIS
jgi:hypothetical protein